MATTDHAKLKQIQDEILKEKKSYLRMKKENVLIDLISLSNNSIQTLPQRVYVPLYERDETFLKQTLERLGYTPEYNEVYNAYLEQDCYEIDL